MITRSIESELRSQSEQYPVVTIIGPRQSGKTTLVKKVFPDYHYCNLENPENREIAENDPKTLFDLFPTPVIFDEIQRAPKLLSWIQIKVDEEKKQGQYILTGSHQLSLHASVSQSLAGRTSLLTLLPLSIDELKTKSAEADKYTQMYRGFLPRIYDENQNPTTAYRNYFQTYVERDVRQISQIKNLSAFEKFIKLLAGRIGQPINLSSLSNDIGISSTTLGEWLSILEASFIIYPLRPYYKNFGKRLIKSPKIYFIETGLAVWLLGIENEKQLMRDPLFGNLFENMVIMDVLKQRFNSGKESNLYYWRDNNQNEVDLIVDIQRKLTPVEIKSAKTWNQNFARAILWMQKNIQETGHGYIVYDGDLFPSNENYQAIHYGKISTALME